MTWQSEVPPEEWEEWQKFARKISRVKNVPTSLGHEDYAASAMERLIEQRERPENIEAWLRKTIKNQYIDRFRKIQLRGGPSKREMTDEEWELEMLSYAVGSPSAMLVLKDSVDEILAQLKDREKEILILSTAGYDNHEIALYLNYASNKVVATRLAQITEKVRKAVQKRPASHP
jgi:RNA polymerase sigma factor (sigma-70 family)